MILLPLILTLAVAFTAFNEPVPVNKTSKQLYEEGIGHRK